MPAEASMEDNTLLKRIVANPKTFGGAPCIRDTRVPVETVLSLLAQGATYDELIADFEITREDIQACIAYAFAVIAGQTLEAVEVRKA
jgi:uncharacterized protein (DUF433 family)